MMSRLGKTVLVCDLDPQANLNAAFLDESQLEHLFDTGYGCSDLTIYQCVAPLTQVGDILTPRLMRINEGLFLIPGDLALSGFEDFLSSEWLYRPFRVLSAFWQIAQLGAQKCKADLVLVDVGPNLGAINRSALIASDFVLVPLAADLFYSGSQKFGPNIAPVAIGLAEAHSELDRTEFRVADGKDDAHRLCCSTA